jgi:carbon monoxide dehydrogenase subunit G
MVFAIWYMVYGTRYDSYFEWRGRLPRSDSRNEHIKTLGGGGGRGVDTWKGTTEVQIRVKGKGSQLNE